jgi:hypothetical protein
MKKTIRYFLAACLLVTANINISRADYGYCSEIGIRNYRCEAYSEGYSWAYCGGAFYVAGITGNFNYTISVAGGPYGSGEVHFWGDLQDVQVEVPQNNGTTVYGTAVFNGPPTWVDHLANVYGGYASYSVLW